MPPRNSVHRLGLGTVQFGLPYGITNMAGQVPKAVVEPLLGEAADAGLVVLDTAALYGTSETVLGEVLPAHGHWRIVTKTAKFDDVPDASVARSRLVQTFRQSLSNLGRETVYGLLAHDADDLLGPNGDALWDQMAALRLEGVVQKIGASVYTPEQIEGLLQRHSIDLIQVPFNAVDRRLTRAGLLDELASRGIEIHARSIFLQGLLLRDPETLEAHFSPLRAAVAGLNEQFRQAGLSPLEGNLAAMFRQTQIDHLIVGVTGVDELRQILAAAKKASQFAGELDIEQWAISDTAILNPAAWPGPTARR